MPPGKALAGDQRSSIRSNRQSEPSRPKHRESDEVAHRGNVTKKGSRLVRWAAIEAIAKMHGGPKIKSDYRRIAARRGVKVGRVAAARKLLTLVYYGLRDGEIRCLAQAEQAG